MDAVRAVRLDLFNSGINVDVFDSNGDGDVGYKVYQVSYGSGGDLIYERVSWPAWRNKVTGSLCALRLPSEACFVRMLHCRRTSRLCGSGLLWDFPYCACV